MILPRNIFSVEADQPVKGNKEGNEGIKEP